MLAENVLNLPKGWIQAPLPSVCTDIIGGGTPSRSILEYFNGDIVWLTPTEIPKEKISIMHDSREKITADGLKKSSARLIPSGSVLLTSRASIGYVAIAGREVTTNQGFASFICSDAIHNFYLAYWLWSNKELLEAKATGTTFKEISKSKIRELSLPLPPLSEQRRIVSKID
jgi:type I restriction enzyme S subunit